MHGGLLHLLVLSRYPSPHSLLHLPQEPHLPQLPTTSSIGLNILSRHYTYIWIWFIDVEISQNFLYDEWCRDFRNWLRNDNWSKANHQPSLSLLHKNRMSHCVFHDIDLPWHRCLSHLATSKAMPVHGWLMHLRILARPHPPDLMVHLPHDPQSPQSPSPSKIGQMYWWGITLLLRKKRLQKKVSRIMRTMERSLKPSKTSR